jgi:Ribonuclease G/E
VLGEALAAALAEDPLGAQLLGFSHVGLAEIRRPRIRAPLAEMLRGPHAAGLAALRVAAREAAVFPARTLALRAAPPIVAALVADPVALRQYRAMAGRELVLRADPALAGPAVVGPGFTGWRLEDG